MGGSARSVAVGLAVAMTVAGCGSHRPGRVPTPAAQRLIGAGLAVDPGTGDIVAFGGQDRVGRQVKPSATMWRWTGDRWEPASATEVPPARSQTLLTADPHHHRLLLFGGRTQTTTVPSCPAPVEPGRACSGTVSPVRTLSDTWAYRNGTWWRLASGGGIPQAGRLLSYDPALKTALLVGQSLAGTPSSVRGTWNWTGRRWSLLSPTSPTAADTLAYDRASHRLLAYGGREPFTAGPRMGAPNSPGYARTWAFGAGRWSELHPHTLPDRAPGVLTASPDGHLLLLINTHGHIWSWTGRDWQPYPTHGAPVTDRPPWAGATLSAATDLARHQVLLLVTGGEAGDETWTLHDGQWTPHASTP